MISPAAKQTIQSLCPEVDGAFLEDFFARMDEDYFATFQTEDIATHIRMSSNLGGEHRVQVRITSRRENEFDVIIVGFDYLSQFSIFCGLLSAFALDIRSGDIYSFSKNTTRGSAGRVVDVFRVAIKPGNSFDQSRQNEFAQELQTLANLLAQGFINEARERLNRFLIERIEAMEEPLSGLLRPIDLDFDNHLSPDWTVMNAASEDTFAFLYAVSNALSLRGIYIHKVRIRNVGRDVQDQFFIADRWGRKIQDIREQERLRMAVAMIKQFTRFLPEAPDPAKAMRHFDQLMDRIIEISEEELLDRTLAFLADSEGMSMLAHLLGSSDFLWDEFLQIHFTDLLPVLKDFAKAGLHPISKSSMSSELHKRLATTSKVDEKKLLLNQFKARQLFLIDLQHLLEPTPALTEFSQALTDLAEVVIEEVATVCFQEAPYPFAICGLGKFGGREMGYASDLELLFVHEDAGSSPFFEARTRQIIDFIETRNKGIFQIDLRLRPHGDAGAWCPLIEEFEKYYSSDGGAAPFERQALIKLRWFAGNEELGRRIESHRDSFTYSSQPWDWENAMHLRQRQMRELVKPGQINVKYSAGGIVDIEYAVQYLQLLNGKDHSEIRVPTTLIALERLRRLQIVREEDYAVLHSAYLFLRNLIDALRIVRGDASDLVLPPDNSEEFKSLARRLGYREKDRTKGAALLAAHVRQTMEGVHTYFVGRFASSPSDRS